MKKAPAKKARSRATTSDKDLVGDSPALVADTADGAVLITGICGRLGRLLTRRLHRVTDVIGVDRRPFPSRPKDVVHHELDLRRKKTRDIFRQGRIRAVVHLGVLH
ncbi:MAG: NAD-dependent epimerase/dehydratase family protein, partial [Deltaproteobacteria bacterium]|nr:NAD-dependent epimerase/dehydratase family protein [Deltaproteobacteria bacterium]